MQTTHIETIGTALPGKVRAYRKSPGDFDLAASAAAYYAAKHGEEMVIVPGNSYGSRVFHIVKSHEALAQFAIPSGAVVRIAIVDPNGCVALADAS